MTDPVPGGAVAPTFLVIGAMKSGTSSLHRYLGEHPQVFTTETKELDYFVPRRNWERGWDWYVAHFTAGRGAVARGESSTSYSMAPALDGVPERIASCLPDVRLVYLLRHPLERIRSMYLHALTRGQEWRPLENAVRRERGYVDASRYAFQLERYLPHVDREQVHVVLTRDLAARPRETLARIHRHIGVDPGLAPVPPEHRHHVGGTRVPRPVDRWAARTPLVRSLRQRPVASRAGRLYRRLATAPVDTSQVVLSDRLREWVLDEFLRDDLRRLRGHLGAGFDAWGLLD